MRKLFSWILLIIIMIAFPIANILSIKGMGPPALPKVMIFVNGAFGIIGLIVGVIFIIGIGVAANIGLSANEEEVSKY